MAESITELKTKLSLAVAYLIVNNDNKFKIPMDLWKRLKKNLADWKILETKYNDIRKTREHNSLIIHKTRGKDLLVYNSKN